MRSDWRTARFPLNSRVRYYLGKVEGVPAYTIARVIAHSGDHDLFIREEGHPYCERQISANSVLVEPLDACPHCGRSK